MRFWTPQLFYDAKPWALIIIGGALGLGMMLWSLSAGVWTPTRSVMCLAGAAMSIVGGATLQLRQDYRARSKWRREFPRN